MAVAEAGTHGVVAWSGPEPLEIDAPAPMLATLDATGGDLGQGVAGRGEGE